MKGRIVVLDTGASLVDLASPALREAGYVVDAVDDVERIGVPPADAPGVVVLDACIPHAGGPPQLVRELRARRRWSILQVSGCEMVDVVSRAHPVHADGFLVRPVGAAEVVEAVDRLASRNREPNGDFHGMWGRSRAMTEVFDAVRMVAPTDSTVLLTGETGTGKEMVAKAIHERSEVADGPFVAVDCGSLSESLLTSELFGHTRGAFTGAHEERRGLFEAANGGTLFLDEVGDMSPRLQGLLLRALQEGRIRRVGGTHMIAVDTRCVAATNRDLDRDVREGRFRKDLLYRLKVFSIHLPPLRERREDIEVIVAGDGRREGRSLPEVTPAAMAILRGHSWPGNVRELVGVLEGARIRAQGMPVDVEHLPPSMLDATDRAGGPGPDAPPPASEADEIRMALRESGGHRGRAAERLGISRTTLWRRMRELEIDAPSD